MNKEKISEIISQVQATYQSMDTPSFYFVEKIFSSKPYRKVLDTIERKFIVAEDIDLNDDVCFTYVLAKDEQKWILQISMVGRFAIFYRINKDGSVGEPIYSETKNISSAEFDVLDILKKNEIKLLELETLISPIPIKLWNTSEGETKIYQALFSDIEVMPWSDV